MVDALDPARATAFEALVDDYDAARPGYPESLYDALPPLAGTHVLELGAGTGKQLPGLLARGAEVVSTDRGPNMLARLRRNHPAQPVVVARAEQLPFRSGAFDAVCGAQMWHWVSVPEAVREVTRVLRPGGWLAVWWNDSADSGQGWFRALSEHLEAADPGYHRNYRRREFGDELAATGAFASVTPWIGHWERQIDWPTYERSLLSRSYVAALPDVPAFLAVERESMAAAFPDGRIAEPFDVHLWVARVA